MNSDGGCGDPGLWGRATRIPYDELTNQYSLEQYHSRPAKVFFRDIMIRFHTLEWIPFDNVISYGRENNPKHDDLELLFRTYGWPDHFDGDAFDDGAKRYREFQKVKGKLDEPKNALEDAKRSVEDHKKRLASHTSRKIEGIWDRGSNPGRSPEETAKLEVELKMHQDGLGEAEKKLAQLEGNTATGPSIDVVWKEVLEVQIRWLQNNIDYWKSKETEDHSQELKESEEKRDRLKQHVENAQNLPRTSKEAIEPGKGGPVGIW